MSETDYQQLEILNKHLLEANKDLGKEIERLNKERETDIKYNKYLQKELTKANSIIKEVRELRNKISNLYYEEGYELDTPMLLKYIDEILDKVNKENNNE